MRARTDGKSAMRVRMDGKSVRRVRTDDKSARRVRTDGKSARRARTDRQVDDARMSVVNMNSPFPKEFLTNYNTVIDNILTARRGERPNGQIERPNGWTR